MRKPRIFYGWYILGLTMMGGVLGASFSQFFMGVMLKPISNDLGWSRTAVTGAVTLGTVTTGLLSPVFGKLADRHGPRVLSGAAVVVITGAYFAMANVTHLWQLYLAYTLGRVFSQNTFSGVVATTTAVNWFHRMRGRTIGMVQMAMPLGGSALALSARLLMEGGSSWRTVFATLGGIILVSLFLPVVAVMRRHPEDLGLLPDGERDPVSAQLSEVSNSTEGEYGWTLSQVVRTSTLWLLIAAITLGVGANGAVGFHLMAYYTDRHIATTLAVTALSAYALAGALANGLWGFVVEHVSERHLAAGTMFMAAGLILYLISVSTPAGAFAFAVLFGLAARGESSLVMMIFARYYGRRSFGTIAGFTVQFQMVSLALGPLWASIFFDISGSYIGAFSAASVMYVLAGVMIWMAKKPAQPREAMAGQLI